MSFTIWLKARLSANSAHKYSAAVSGVISDWAMAAKLIDAPLTDIHNLQQRNRLLPKITALAIFQARNTKGKGMYLAALNQYAAYLAHKHQPTMDEDVLEVLEQEISQTEKQTLISARIGQGVFRKNLFKHWQGCAVTGYTDPQLLVASHIKPWHASSHVERLDPYNGFLLLPNLDRAFDSGLISFEESGAIALSPALKKPELLGITNSMRITLQAAHLPYLRFHQAHVFKPEPL